MRESFCAHGGFVRGVAADVKQAAVDERVQRLHAAVEHFGKAGVFADVLHGEAGLAQGFGGAAGGKQLDAVAGENLGERHEAGFIGNREQSTLDFHAR